ncbi:MAG: hypothetical protein RLZ55_1690, partial [Actinomycetota bacterium]
DAGQAEVLRIVTDGATDASLATLVRIPRKGVA